MAKFPALPLWTDAWVADTKHLDRCERGTYHDLLVLMWRTPGCRVPNDDEWLAKRLNMSLQEVSNQLRPLIKEFCGIDASGIYQKRLRKEFDYILHRREKQAMRAKARWNKEKDLCLGIAASGNASSGNALSTPIPTPLFKNNNHIGNVQRYAFDGKVIKLNKADADKWRKRFPAFNGSFEGYLESRDAWLATRPKDEQEKWFLSTAAWLAKKNAELLAKNPPKKKNPAVGSEEWKQQQREAGLFDD